MSRYVYMYIHLCVYQHSSTNKQNISSQFHDYSLIKEQEKRWYKKRASLGKKRELKLRELATTGILLIL